MVEKQQILIQQNLEVLSLFFWFLLVLHWAVDVIEVIYYIRGPRPSGVLEETKYFLLF